MFGSSVQQTAVKEPQAIRRKATVPTPQQSLLPLDNIVMEMEDQEYCSCGMNTEAASTRQSSCGENGAVLGQK